MIKKIYLYLLLVLVFTLCSCESMPTYNVTINMIIDTDYFTTPIASHSFKVEEGSTLPEDQIYYLQHQLFGKDSLELGYKLYTTSELKVPVTQYIITSDTQLYVRYKCLDRKGITVDEYNNLEKERDYLVTYYKTYTKVYNNVSYTFNNCLVMEDPTNILLVKEIDGNTITKEQIIEFLTQFYTKVYEKPALVDSGYSDAILDGPFSTGDTYGVQVLLNFSYDNYSKEDVKNYLPEAEKIETYQINSDVVYFQVFAEK